MACVLQGWRSWPGSDISKRTTKYCWYVIIPNFNKKYDLIRPKIQITFLLDIYEVLCVKIAILFCISLVFYWKGRYESGVFGRYESGFFGRYECGFFGWYESGAVGGV